MDSSIKSGSVEIKTPGSGVAGPGEAPKAAKAAKAPAAAKPVAIADASVRTSGAVAFAPSNLQPAEGGEETTNVGRAITAIAVVDTPRAVAAESVVVWQRENNWTSQGKTRVVALPGVTLSPAGVKAQWVHVTGTTQVESIDNQAPFENGSKVTRDAFDQANLVADGVFLNQLQSAVGMDNNTLWRASRNSGFIRSKANGITDLNAFYSPTANDQTYGTNSGKWHLASDNDVTRHETGHNRGDKQNPDMFSGEGGAIHEGYFGDFNCALIARNPFLSEDFGSALGTPGQPLRNLDNDKTLRQAGSEVHDRGEAYGGFGWRVTQALAKRIGNLDQACDIMLHVALKTGYYFTTKSPSPKDFIDAVARCVRDALPRVVDAATVDFIMAGVKAEGVKREMITSAWQEPPKVSTDAVTVALQQALKVAAIAPAGIVTRAIDGILGKRADAEIVTVGELKWKSTNWKGLPGASGPEVASQKQIMQLRAIDPASGKKYNVQDGFMSMVASDQNVSGFDGGGRRILEDKSYKFDFTPLPGDRAALVKEAKEAIDKFIKSQLEQKKNIHLNSHLRANLASLFEDVEVEEVMFKGKISLMLTSPAGQFIYDHLTHTVEARRLMFVDFFKPKKN